MSLLLAIIYLAFISLGLPDALLGSAWPGMQEQMNVPVSYAGIITMIISCFTPLTALVYSIPSAVIGGISIYLFGIIASQCITIMISKKVDMFDSRNLAIISTILIIGLGGSFAFSDGMIPMFGAKFPAIASAAIFGILLNLILSIGKKEEKKAE